MLSKFIVAASALVASVLLSNGASASPSSRFDCSISEGEFLMVEIIPEEGVAILSDSRGSDRMEAVRNGFYQGSRRDGVTIGFDRESVQLHMESEQWPCYQEPAGQTHEDGAVGGNEIFDLNHQGRSLGGKLRGGPGTNFRQTGSLSEGTPVTILTNTGILFSGYAWFEIVTDQGMRGYQWGGIMCSNGHRIAGIYTACAN